MFIFFWQEVEPTTWQGLKRGGDFFLPSWLKHKFQVSSCREARHQSKTKKNKQHTFTENNRLAKTISRIFINVYDFVRLTPNLLQFFVFFNLLQVLCYFLRLCMLRLFLASFRVVVYLTWNNTYDILTYFCTQNTVFIPMLLY